MRSMLLLAFALTGFQASRADDKGAAEAAEIAEGEKLLESLSKAERHYVLFRLFKSKTIPNMQAYPPTVRVGRVGYLVSRAKGNTQNDSRYIVDQVVDSDEMLIRNSELWLEGFSTEGLADGNAVDLAGVVFVVAGTKSYETAIGGQRTVKHLVAIDTKAVDPILKEVLQKKAFVKNLKAELAEEEKASVE